MQTVAGRAIDVIAQAKQEILELRAESADLMKLAYAIVRLESSPMQKDYVSQAIQRMARKVIARVEGRNV